LRITLAFLDGVGLGPDDPVSNPLARRGLLCNLERLTGRRLLQQCFPWAGERSGGVAVDAVLGVPGLPQSATGQVTLLTGINAQAALGRHQNGFPGRVLQLILAEHSVFRQLAALGRPGTFANAFTAEYFAAVATGRWRHSATTLAALSGGVRLRLLADLLTGQAVYQDLTREGLREWGYDMPPGTPEEAGICLAEVARGFAVTLFEYFQTDIAGHGRDMALAAARLGQVDRFLGSLLAATDLEAGLVVVASDHGNIEDLGTQGHTANAVPVLAFGQGAADFLAGLTRLDQVTPRILSAVGKC